MTPFASPSPAVASQQGAALPQAPVMPVAFGSGASAPLTTTQQQLVVSGGLPVEQPAQQSVPAPAVQLDTHDGSDAEVHIKLR